VLPPTVRDIKRIPTDFSVKLSSKAPSEDATAEISMNRDALVGNIVTVSKSMGIDLKNTER
jgi:hypothetical protein